MRHFVRQQLRQLGFILGAQQGARPHHQRAIGQGKDIQARRFHDIEAQSLARRDAAKHAVHIGVQRRITHQGSGVANIVLGLGHLHEKSGFIAVRIRLGAGCTRHQ